MYPNPTDGLICCVLDSIDPADASWELLDITGRLLKILVPWACCKTGQAELDISAFMPGIYLIRCKTKEFSLTAPVVRR